MKGTMTAPHLPSNHCRSNRKWDSHHASHGDSRCPKARQSIPRSIPMDRDSRSPIGLRGSILKPYPLNSKPLLATSSVSLISGDFPQSSQKEPTGLKPCRCPTRQVPTPRLPSKWPPGSAMRSGHFHAPSLSEYSPRKGEGRSRQPLEDHAGIHT